MSDNKQTTVNEHAKRITHLRDVLFQKNSARMAGALGCSRSLVARVVAGDQKPGRRLLEAVATLPNVNSEWLLKGIGTALFEARETDALTGSVLPVTRCLFSGSPDENDAHLTGEYFPIATTFHKSSRYWLRPDYPPDKLIKDLRIESGDLLLMESDKKFWKRPEQVHRRICIFRYSWTRSPTLHLGEASFDPSRDEPNQVFIHRFLPTGSEAEKANQSRPHRQIGETPQQMTVELSAIVATAVLLMRRFDSSFDTKSNG